MIDGVVFDATAEDAWDDDAIMKAFDQGLNHHKITSSKAEERHRAKRSTKPVYKPSVHLSASLPLAPHSIASIKPAEIPPIHAAPVTPTSHIFARDFPTPTTEGTRLHRCRGCDEAVNELHGASCEACAFVWCDECISSGLPTRHAAKTGHVIGAMVPSAAPPAASHGAWMPSADPRVYDPRSGHSARDTGELFRSYLEHVGYLPPTPAHHAWSGFPHSSYRDSRREAPPAWPRTAHHHATGLTAGSEELDDPALNDMLLSWYKSGYHTGYYKAQQDMQRKR